MKKKMKAIMTIAAVGAMVATASAGERAGAFSISPFAGGYTFDGVQKLHTSPVYGLRLGLDLTNHLGVEATGSYLSAEGIGPRASANAISYRLDFLYNFLDGPLVPYVAVGGGGITIGHGSSFDSSSRDADSRNLLGYLGRRNTTGTADAGFGLKYYVTDSVALRGDARQVFVFGRRTMYNWEYTAGMTFLIGGKATPAPAAVTPVVQTAVAPTSNLSVTPASINKGESATLSWTSENTSSCEIQPLIGKVNTRGTLSVNPAADTTYTLTCSGEGGTTSSSANIAIAAVAPAPALAPTSSITVTPASITKGEPATLNWTSQNATKCEIQPGFGSVNLQGQQSVTPMADTTYTLICTGEGGATSSSSGTVQVVAKKERICIVLKIEFDTGKAIIKPKYHGEIGKVAEFMNKYPEAHGVIEGHTDNVGGAAYNMKLSERRAAAVKQYLVDKYNIDSSRLSSKGFGYTQPIASNKTKAGRQKNRRIQATFDCVITTK